MMVWELLHISNVICEKSRSNFWHKHLWQAIKDRCKLKTGCHNSMPRKKYYIVPVHFTYATAATLLVSLLLNTIGILVYLKGDFLTV